MEHLKPKRIVAAFLLACVAVLLWAQEGGAGAAVAGNRLSAGHDQQKVAKDDNYYFRYNMWKRDYDREKQGMLRGYAIAGFSVLGVGLSLALALNSDSKAYYLLCGGFCTITAIFGGYLIVNHSKKLRQLKENGRQQGFLYSIQALPLLDRRQPGKLSGAYVSLCLRF